MKELRSVSVPVEMAGPFREAEQHVEGWFRSFHQDPEHGTITIGGERYILVRAASMSVHFAEFIRSMYPGLEEEDAVSVVNRLLFDIAHSLGENDAKNFHEKTGVTDPIGRLSTGPVHFAWTGWAFVDLLPESRPSADDDCYLIYDHPQSFECDAWLAAGHRTNYCVCHMNAGYSSGWCSASFGIRLVSREISCRARGDTRCRFIMAVPERIEMFLQQYEDEHGGDGEEA